MANTKKANLYQSKNELAEFGRGIKGVVICKQCEAVYFKKHWHHSLAQLNLSESASLSKKNKSLKFTLCPACQMIKNRQYEGEVKIFNVPARLNKELEAFIRGFCKRAYDRDPLDRLVAIKQNGVNWVVTVTENELASKLGRKITNLFNNTKVRISFDREPSDVARVVVEFVSK